MLRLVMLFFSACLFVCFFLIGQKIGSGIHKIGEDFIACTIKYGIIVMAVIIVMGDESLNFNNSDFF